MRSEPEIDKGVEIRSHHIAYTVEKQPKEQDVRYEAKGLALTDPFFDCRYNGTAADDRDNEKRKELPVEAAQYRHYVEMPKVKGKHGGYVNACIAQCLAAEEYPAYEHNCQCV